MGGLSSAKVLKHNERHIDPREEKVKMYGLIQRYSWKA